MVPETQSVTSLISLTSFGYVMFAVMACLSLYFGWRSLRPRVQPAYATLRRVQGVVLIASTGAWIGLAAQTHTEPTLSDVNQLPATAAGIPPELIIVKDTPLEIAKAATEASSLAQAPKGADFQHLRNRVTSLLFSAKEFDHDEKSVLINLQSDAQKELIKQIATERPGLLTVIYHRQTESNNKKMVVYFPEVAGDQLIYTPLLGPASQALSRVISN